MTDKPQGLTSPLAQEMLDILKLGEERAKELGILTVEHGRETRKSIHFDDLFRLLGSGQTYRFPEVNPTHGGLLIGIRPLAVESEAFIVKELSGVDLNGDCPIQAHGQYPQYPQYPQQPLQDFESRRHAEITKLLHTIVECLIVECLKSLEKP